METEPLPGPKKVPQANTTEIVILTWPSDEKRNKRPITVLHYIMTTFVTMSAVKMNVFMFKTAFTVYGQNEFDILCLKTIVAGKYRPNITCTWEQML